MRHPFVVNMLEDTDDTTQVIHMADVEGEEWDDLALRRINFQIDCSIAAVKAGMMGFYEFRLQYQPGTRVGLFQDYLRQTDPALKEWRRLWSDLMDRDPSFGFERKETKVGTPRAEASAAMVINHFALTKMLKRVPV